MDIQEFVTELKNLIQRFEGKSSESLWMSEVKTALVSAQEQIQSARSDLERAQNEADYLRSQASEVEDLLTNSDYSFGSVEGDIEDALAFLERAENTVSTL